ncbi:MAG: hypothetical protein HC869_14945 [Rhodospirillales bacterium]|nr:hypothetical protein [Rhodospirillales bacterium]
MLLVVQLLGHLVQQVQMQHAHQPALHMHLNPVLVQNLLVRQVWRMVWR